MKTESASVRFIELQRKLPPFVKQKIVSGIDRYGFSNILARRCGHSVVKRSFANWVHGWIWAEQPSAELLACAKLPRDITVVVRNAREKLALEQDGFRDVRIGGLPFAYIEQQHTSRSKDALLAFPPHSAEAEKINSDQSDYLDYLGSLKNDFEVIVLSLYHLDFGGPMHLAARARGIQVVQGARPDDANSLLRMRSIFDEFEYVTSNVMGSHMLYALYCGCRFSFGGPIYQYSRADLLANQNPHNHRQQHIDSSLLLQSEYYLRRSFGRFFTEHPRAGIQDQEFAAHTIGKDHLMTPREIEDALGWTIVGQINGYLSGARRRFTRALSLTDASS